MNIYVSAIHTDAGKTHFSTVFCANLGYDYFKLIQAGRPTDSEFVAKMSPKTRIFESEVFLQTPVSPHLGKRLENKNYKGLELSLPQSENLLIELAGGLFTPIDEKHTMIDFMEKFKAPAFLIAKYYLGSINHILLSIEALKQRNIKILALVMMGEKEALQDEFVENYAKVPIVNLSFPTKNSILNENFKKQMIDLLSLNDKSN